MDNATIYKEYKLKGFLDSWDLYKKENPNCKIEKTLAKTFKIQFNITKDEYDAFVEEFLDIQIIKPKFASKPERQKDLGGDIVKFYDWYKDQRDYCKYCGVTQNQLELIVKIRGGNLTLNQKTKRSNGTLEIEKRNPSDGYKYGNIILACPLCNNAKSNLIDEKSWCDIFVPAMQAYYNKLLAPLGERIKKNTKNCSHRTKDENEKIF